MSEQTTPGARLRARRRELGISPTELGQRAALVAGRPKPISASAVRNQENGTNGIPYPLIYAYAEVLSVEPHWLLFGSEGGGEPDPAQTEDGDAPLLDDVLISVSGIITAGWIEPTPQPPGHERFLNIWVEQYDNRYLKAFEIVDSSLHPEYPLGTYLICAPAWQVGLHDGDDIILDAIDEDGIVLRGIRRIAKRKAKKPENVGADLIPIRPSDSHPVLDWWWGVNGEGVTTIRRLYPDSVVVATYRPVKPQDRGAPLEHLPEFITDTMYFDRIEDEQGPAAADAAREAGVPRTSPDTKQD